MSKSLLIHAWTVHRYKDEYYLPFTHWVYLNEIDRLFDKICLLSPVNNIEKSELNNFKSLGSFTKLVISDLPYSSGYIDAIKYFFYYLRSYYKMEKFDVVYTRFPIPFGWLQKIFCNDSKRIIHFVGDPMEVTKQNPNFSKFKKRIYSGLFQPEYKMHLWACKGADVFTNGYHLSKKLKIKNINAVPLISSTLKLNDFQSKIKTHLNLDEPKFIYVGYLRKAKGIEVLIDSFEMILLSFPKAQFSIVGSGEFEVELKERVHNSKIRNISFLGHIDEREQLNELLRNHDIFCFASLSEGSPRVIIEAMANGINVVSTPVGSLPDIFKHRTDLLFAEFGNALEFKNQYTMLLENQNLALELRKNAFKKAKLYTLQNFINSIFTNHA